MLKLQQYSGARSVFERALEGFEAVESQEGVLEAHRWLATLHKKLSTGLHLRHFQAAASVGKAIKRKRGSDQGFHARFPGWLQFTVPPVAASTPRRIMSATQLDLHPALQLSSRKLEEAQLNGHRSSTAREYRRAEKATLETVRERRPLGTSRESSTTGMDRIAQQVPYTKAARPRSRSRGVATEGESPIGTKAATKKKEGQQLGFGSSSGRGFSPSRVVKVPSSPQPSSKQSGTSLQMRVLRGLQQGVLGRVWDCTKQKGGGIRADRVH